MAGSKKRSARRYGMEGARLYHAGRKRFDGKILLRAKEMLAASVALHPTPSGFFYLGNTLNLLGRPKTAVRAYLECLRLEPSSAPAHENLAQVFDDLENRTAAHVHYQHWVALEPRSARAKKGLALSYLWAHSDHLQEGSELCNEAAELAPMEPSIPFDCAQLLVLLLPPSPKVIGDEEGGKASAADGSSSHWMRYIEPKFQRAQEVAFRSWRGGPTPVPFSGEELVQWTNPKTCPQGVAVRDPLLMDEVQVEELSQGGAVYGQRFPMTFGGAFTWAGQRYAERGVRLMTLKDVMISGNEGVVTKGCHILVPYYDKQVPWHENLPQQTPANVKWLPVALWLLVMFPANFFSFLVDELARLAVWLSVRRQRVPLLVPADRGRLKPFMYDWFTLLGGFQVIPYDVRPHFTGEASEPRFLVRELHMVDWFDAPGRARREDVFLLPPRWALQRLQGLVWSTGRPPQGPAKTVLWIQRATATTRRVANEDELLEAVMAELPGWRLRIFSDRPDAAPTAREAVELFRAAELVLGVHGSGQANIVFCRAGTGIVDINLPEPHSQYTAHNSYALQLRYRLVMLRGVGLHQALNLTIPVEDVLLALRSLTQETAAKT